MKIYGLISLAAFAYSAAAAYQHRWFCAFLAFCAAALFTRMACPELAGPAEEPKGPARINWLFLLAGIVAGWYGAHAWATQAPNWWMGAPLQVAALYAFIQAFPRKTSPPSAVLPVTVPVATGPFPAMSIPAMPLPPTPPPPSPVPFFPALILFGIAGFALYSFSKGDMTSGLLYLGIALFSAWILGLRYQVTGDPTGRTSEWRWFCAILLLAVLMRFPFVHQHFTGLQIDEANHLLDGAGVLEGRLKSPFVTGWWGNPSFVYFWYAAFFKLFGMTLPVGRALSACLSIGALVYFYRLARFFVAPAAALLTTLMFAFSWYHMFYSLSPFTDIFTVLFELATFYHLERAFRQGRRSDYVWAGLWMAASVMSYISGRLVVGMVAVTVLFRLILGGRAFLREHARHLLLMGLAFLWLIGPFLYFIYYSPGEFFGRAQELSILNEVKRLNDHWLPVRTYAGTLMAFFYNPNPDSRFGLYNVPMVDPLVAVLILIGFGLCLARLRSALTWVVLPGFLIAVLSNALAIQGQNPSPTYVNQQRLFLILPFAYLLVARGLDWLTAGWKNRGSIGRRLRWPLLGLAILTAGLWNGKVYYRDIQNANSAWDSMAFSHLQLADICEEAAPTHHLFAYWEIHSSVLQFLFLNRIQCITMDENFPIPPRYRAEKDVLFIFIPWRSEELQERVRKTYPGAVWKEYRNRFDRVTVKTATVTKQEYDQVQARAGVVPTLKFK